MGILMKYVIEYMLEGEGEVILEGRIYVVKGSSFLDVQIARAFLVLVTYISSLGNLLNSKMQSIDRRSRGTTQSPILPLTIVNPSDQILLLTLCVSFRRFAGREALFKVRNNVVDVLCPNTYPDQILRYP